MAKLAYIRQIASDTYLHCTHKGQATCQRDYSRGPHVPPSEIRAYTCNEIQQLLCLPGNRCLPAPYRPWEETAFWYEQIAELNTREGLPGSGDVEPPRRLLDLFHSQVGPLLTAGDTVGLSRLLTDWSHRFEAVVDKVDFNHWDHDDATQMIDPRTGIGWTSALLEHSRAGGDTRYVITGAPDLDFTLIAMDLHLGISSQYNPFGKGLRDFIKPDGLAARRDGSLAVLEVKAEEDSADLFRATLQGLCGTLAVYAKRELMTRLAKRHGLRRPAIPEARLPSDVPSLGLYLLVAKSRYRWPDDRGFQGVLSLILKSFPALREIAFFAVDPRRVGFPGQLNVERVITRADRGTE